MSGVVLFHCISFQRLGEDRQDRGQDYTEDGEDTRPEDDGIHLVELVEIRIVLMERVDDDGVGGVGHCFLPSLTVTKDYY